MHRVLLIPSFVALCQLFVLLNMTTSIFTLKTAWAVQQSTWGKGSWVSFYAKILALSFQLSFNGTSKDRARNSDWCENNWSRGIRSFCEQFNSQTQKTKNSFWRETNEVRKAIHISWTGIFSEYLDANAKIMWESA